MNRISRKLGALREADREFEVRGAEVHQYRLHPPIDEGALKRHESRYGFLVPEEYRAFLTSLGNGGTGPECGLRPFEMLDHSKAVIPFPISNAMVLDAGDVTRLQDWKCPFDQGESIDSGWLPISDARCIDMTIVITAGEQRGTIWLIDPYDGFHFKLRRPGVQMGFFDWYEQWLDERLAPDALGRWSDLEL